MRKKAKMKKGERKAVGRRSLADEALTERNADVPTALRRRGLADEVLTESWLLAETRVAEA